MNDHLPSSAPLAGVLANISASFGLESAGRQADVDALIDSFLADHGVNANVLPVQWDRVVISAEDAPAAAVLRYLQGDLRAHLRDAGFTGDVVIRVR